MLEIEKKRRPLILICFLCFPFQFETEDWYNIRNWQKFPQLPVHHHQEENNLRVCFRILIKVWLVQSCVPGPGAAGVTCSDGEGVGGVPSNYRGWMIQLWSKKITSHHPPAFLLQQAGDPVWWTEALFLDLYFICSSGIILSFLLQQRLV